MWTIITRDNCQYCEAAKELFDAKGYQYVSYNVQSKSSKWVLTLVKQAGHKTVPQIFTPDGEHLGGYTELKEYLVGQCEKTF